MKYVESVGIRIPSIAVGCMKLGSVSQAECDAFIGTALDNGLNFFDNADIYEKSASETAVGNSMRALKVERNRVFLQTKCGIVPKVMYDFSKEHILKSVEGSLKRLQTDYLDALLLHRPDVLMEPDEVAEAFYQLEKSGKVCHFGVSNMHPYQIELLKSAVKQPLFANQLQFSPAHAEMVAGEIEVNRLTECAASHDGYILDYCRLNDIVVQAWSPLRSGISEGILFRNEKYAALNNVLEELGEKYGVDRTAIVAAWILRYPVKMQVITGTRKKERLLAMSVGADIVLTREEWYKIYISAGYILP